MHIVGIKHYLKITFLLFCFFKPVDLLADLIALDDTGQTVVLNQPAKRIVALSPHLVELTFAAGAGQYVIAVSTSSNWPAEIKKLPKIGDDRGVDFEYLVKLQPDLVLLWGSNAMTGIAARIRKLGIPVWISQPISFEEVANNIERIGMLANTFAVAKITADAVRQKADALKHVKKFDEPNIRVFFQVWQHPLMTLNRKHFVSQMIELCGGENIFAHSRLSVPAVSLEAVLQLNPHIILIGDTATYPADFGQWQKIPQLVANQVNGLLAIDADLLTRPTPRALTAAQQLCQTMNRVRNLVRSNTIKP